MTIKQPAEFIFEPIPEEIPAEDFQLIQELQTKIAKLESENMQISRLFNEFKEKITAESKRTRFEASWTRALISSTLQYVIFVNFMMIMTYSIDLITNEYHGSLWDRYKVSLITATIPAISSFGKGWAVFSDTWFNIRERRK